MLTEEHENLLTFPLPRPVKPILFPFPEAIVLNDDLPDQDELLLQEAMAGSDSDLFFTYPHTDYRLESQFSGLLNKADSA